MFTVNGFTLFSFFSPHFGGWRKGTQSSHTFDKSWNYKKAVLCLVGCHRSVDVLCHTAWKRFLFIESLLHAKHRTKNLKHDVKSGLLLPSCKWGKGSESLCYSRRTAGGWQSWDSGSDLTLRSAFGVLVNLTVDLVCLEDEKVNVREWILKRCFQKKVLRDFTSVDHLSPLAVFPCSVFS